MLNQIIPSIKATIVIAALTGLLFPFVMTFLSQLIFPHQANGSLIKNQSGQVIGSALIGQAFSKPEYFHPRPSAAGSGYAAEASGGTNLGPSSAKLILGIDDDLSTKDKDESYPGVKQLAENFARENFLKEDEKPPVDAVTRSSSGLDPDISETNALFQARRIARQRQLPLAKVLELVKQSTEKRQFGFLGEPRVNVLKLNLALDDLKP